VRLSELIQACWADFAWAWLLWLTCLCVTLTVTYRAVRQVRWQRLAELPRGEEGAAYTINYMMTLPVYLLMLAFMLEMTFAIMAKIGTVYGAFAAARAATVWSTASDPDAMEAQAHMAARHALAPFASGFAGARLKEEDEESNTVIDQYIAAYQTYADATGRSSPETKYAAAKYRYVFDPSALSVFISTEERAGGAQYSRDLQCSVTYAYPFQTALFGRLLGTGIGPGNYSVLHITSSATMVEEAPRNEARKTGIAYP
jgi:hypothetical protein